MLSNNNIEDIGKNSDTTLRNSWKNLSQLSGRLLELHSEGKLGNSNSAKLPRRPILCIDQVEYIDDEIIKASFTFPEAVSDWPYDASESLEMLFQDQLDQLAGLWCARKADGVGRALSSGACKLHRSLEFKPGKKVYFKLKKKKWINSKSTHIAIFDGRILDSTGNIILETEKVTVALLPLDNDQIVSNKNSVKQEYSHEPGYMPTKGLRIPIYNQATQQFLTSNSSVYSATATQAVNANLWPLQFHIKDDPVMPGNFVVHGLITLLKEVASEHYGIKDPVFISMAAKKFSKMIFEDSKKIRFELKGVKLCEGRKIIAEQANIYLENTDSSCKQNTPIYTLKNLVVAERGFASGELELAA